MCVASAESPPAPSLPIVGMRCEQMPVRGARQCDATPHHGAEGRRGWMHNGAGEGVDGDLDLLRSEE
jgi:hypothetical protein